MEDFYIDTETFTTIDESIRTVTGDFTYSALFDADDAYQECFLQILHALQTNEKIQKIVKEEERKKVLRRIAKNKIINCLVSINREKQNLENAKLKFEQPIAKHSEFKDLCFFTPLTKKAERFLRLLLKPPPDLRKILLSSGNRHTAKHIVGSYLGINRHQVLMFQQEITEKIIVQAV